MEYFVVHYIKYDIYQPMIVYLTSVLWFRMPEPNQASHFRAIADAIQTFRNSDFLCDTILIAEGGKEFRAHSIVLAAASPVFRDRFAASGVGGIIHLAGFDPEIVEIALDVVYDGKLRLSEIYADEGELRRLMEILLDLGLDEEKLNGCEITFVRYSMQPILVSV